MLRRSIASVLGMAMVAALAPVSPAGAQSEPPAVPDPMRAFHIFPPGQHGDVTALELATGSFHPHYDDRLDMYASLIEAADVTEGNLGEFFIPMQFGPTEVQRSYEPTDGVTVFRGGFGIPHIYADSLEKASFALGYVTAEDRLWESDVLRHAARGKLAELVGPAFLDFDVEVRRESYTDEEIQEMLDALPEKFGADGQAVIEGLDAYADGINAYIARLRSNPADCPAEYAATQNPCPGLFPREWSPLDTAHLVVLQLRVFGETAGSELQNAGLYAYLQRQLGEGLGARVFHDLYFQNDPRAPATVPASEGRFPSQRLGSVNPGSFAIPDDAEELARDTAARDAARDAVLKRLGLMAPASNALLVAPEKSATGNPLQVGAPQVGYAVPSFFMDVDVHAPGVDFRGPAVPGASALIPLGRGADYAWSLTTGVSDAVDVRAELLCEPGGEPSEDSNAYMFEGECHEMESRQETFIAKPSAASPGAPGMHNRTFYRTVHGPVFARGTVDGEPVAFVKERFFWKKELDSVPQFYIWNTGVRSLGDFRRAASRFTLSFNAFYADAENIAHFHVGHYPRRTPGVHPALPIWGTGRWEWRGRLPFALQPQVVNPERGWLANWNNKPAVGWDNLDGADRGKWGAIQRVQHLNEGMHALFRGGRKARLSDLVEVIRDAATQDTRAAYVGPRMVAWAADAAGDKSEQFERAVEVVRDWIRRGAHRKNLDRDDHMDDGDALAIFDRWYEEVVRGIFSDELGGQEGFDLARILISDYSPTTGSSFFHDFSSFLANLFHPRHRQRYARNYCDDMTTDRRETCPEQVVAALERALALLTRDQGRDITEWSAPAENIRFDRLGAGGVPDIPWQNRGTHNHVVEILGRARR